MRVSARERGLCQNQDLSDLWDFQDSTGARVVRKAGAWLYSAWRDLQLRRKAQAARNEFLKIL